VEKLRSKCFSSSSFSKNANMGHLAKSFCATPREMSSWSVRILHSPFSSPRRRLQQSSSRHDSENARDENRTANAKCNKLQITGFEFSGKNYKLRFIACLRSTYLGNHQSCQHEIDFYTVMVIIDESLLLWAVLGAQGKIYSKFKRY